MSAENKSELVRRCFRAFNTSDRAEIERLLAPDFTFTSPLDDAIDRAAYFERCWPNSDRIREHIIERIFVEGDAAFVTYFAITYEDLQFRNTEFMTFVGDQIATVDVYFGASYADGAFKKQG
jgi:ketosteroid isomerase-like protein